MDGDLSRTAGGLDRELIWSMAFWLFIGGMIGGRAFYVIEYWHERFRYRQLPRDAVASDQLSRRRAGGLRRTVRRRDRGAVFHSQARLPALATFDLIAPSMVIGLALGRIGCFLNGCCYGGPTRCRGR